MERLGEEINQPVVDAWRAANDVEEGDLVAPDTRLNLKAGDNVLLCYFLPLVVYGPAPENADCFFGGYDPWFGPDPMAFLVSDITDRIGPNGETMPIVDPEEPEPEEEVP